MPPLTQSLKFQQTINTSPQQVYNAFINSTALREWLCNLATVNPKPGGHLFLSWNAGFYASGEYLVIKPEKLIEFTWFGRGYPRSTKVKVRFIKSQNGTQIELEHRKIGTSKKWVDIIEEIKRGWISSLENLASVLTTGQDLRFVRRPMLGITFNDFNETIAKKLGVPVKEGVRLDNVLEGMGAQAAGLKSGDVIVSISGKPVSGYQSVSTILQSLRAGDEVEVVYYRGMEKKNITMKLSGRPIPEIPGIAKDLSEAVQKKYAEFDKGFNQFLDQVIEEESFFKGQADEWSVKETIAHLIQSDRSTINWMADLLGGQEPHYDDFGGNQSAYIKATVSAHQTIDAMRQERKRLRTEIVDFLANLPEEFLDRKGSFWRMAYNLLDSPYHDQIHLEQMQKVIEVARKS